MSVLLVLLPARRRWHPQTPDSAPSAAGQEGADTFGYVLTQDGRGVSSEGECAAALLPKATTVVAVVPDTDVSFHAITLPKAPANRLRAALAGLLEEVLLAEADDTHLALAPHTTAGQRAWVAACDRAWLSQHLQTLEGAGRPVDRVVPLSAPLRPPAPPATEPSSEAGPPSVISEFGSAVHVHLAPVPGSTLGADEPADVMVTVVDPQGVAVWPARGAPGRNSLTSWLRSWEEPVQVSAHPAVAGEAQRWTDHPVAVLGDAQRLLRASTSDWQLRQFDLAPRHRGLALVRDAWRRFLAPDWGPARWGVAALFAAQLIGLNVWAWHERQQLQQLRQAQTRVLQDTHPQVRAILDAPRQMQRENESLRARAGRAGDTDVETALAAAASTWPEGSPIEGLQYAAGVLTLRTAGPADAARQSLRDTLSKAGWRVEGSGQEIVMRRADKRRAPQDRRGPREDRNGGPPPDRAEGRRGDRNEGP